MAYHHRLATIAVTLALAAGVPAAAAAQQPAHPGSPATGSPCSEVCSGGGYGPGTSTTTSPAYSWPIILNHLGNQGNPAPCSEVCSGGGYGTGSPPSPTATITPTAVRVVTQSAGFDWGDAGIGAGGMLVLIVIGLGGALTLTRRRNHHIHGHTPQNGRSEEKRAAGQPV
jgi:hypothetical protein